MHPSSVLPTTAAGWQSPRAAPGFMGNEFAVGTTAQVPDGQVPAWSSNMQSTRQTFVAVPSTFPGQALGPSPGPAYPSSGLLPGPSAESIPGYSKSGSFQQPDQASGSQLISQYGRQPNGRPGSGPPTGQPPVYHV
eukprot:TRINITY_DN3757_c0_g1_i3.p1 TRINITY_DN3757_c0_g1~~TRINITY_DN3757_c0_g1_i3.p1  ORF type:complete len:136 (-),score=25.88 TRINITY_DN3757_c0_g1_i3:194-601(-)